MGLLTTRPKNLLEVCKSLSIRRTVFQIEKKLPLPEELCLPCALAKKRDVSRLVWIFPQTTKLARKKLRKAAVAHHLQMLDDSELTTT
jgi:prolyl-tRNA editing enzyme YbaK/EbsC (Cys-tRNA(Pro) deacylase)